MEEAKEYSGFYEKSSSMSSLVEGGLLRVECGNSRIWKLGCTIDDMHEWHGSDLFEVCKVGFPLFDWIFEGTPGEGASLNISELIGGDGYGIKCLTILKEFRIVHMSLNLLY